MEQGERRGGAATGFTLTELLVGIGVLAIAIAIAIPSFTEIVARSHLKAAAEALRAELVFARSEAVKRSRTVVVSLATSSDGSWCFGSRVASACDCRVADATSASFCFLDSVGTTRIRKTFSGEGHRGVTVAPNFSGANQRDVAFSPVRPTLAAGSATFSANNQSLRVVVSSMGRIRICSPGSTVGGYPAC